MTILRDPKGAAAGGYDLVVVGGGIQGATLLLEAALRGLRVALVEREDFGGATSWNHLRILHGGLRYLQHADLRRHRESVVERRWFLRHLPELVAPLPCLMAAEGRGLRHPLALAVAARLDHGLARGRNRDVREELRLPPARLLRGPDLRQRRPVASGTGLLWFDAFMPWPRRVLIEILHLACDRNAVALNYAEAVELLRAGGAVAGVAVRDRVDGGELELHAPVVVNATGPEARALASRWDADRPRLGARTLAWNVLLDLKLPGPTALAVRAPRPGAPTLFLVPWEGRTLAGTAHAPAPPDPAAPRVDAEALARFLDDLAAAAPDLDIRPDRVLRVYAGFLPGVREGSARLTRRPAVLDHRTVGGPAGLWSVVGIKFTTARRVAQEVLRRIAPTRPASGLPLPGPEVAQRRLERAGFGPDVRPEDREGGLALLGAMVRDEAVVHLEDLLLRRTCLAEDPRVPPQRIERLAAAGPWRGEVARREVDRAVRALGGPPPVEG